MPYATFASVGEVRSLADFVKTDAAKAAVVMLPYSKNCVAMALSRCMGINVFATVNYLKRRGYISKGTDLENDTKFEPALEGLGVTQISDKSPWSSAQTTIRGCGAGRYFCVNYGSEEVSADYTDHAFTVIHSATFKPSAKHATGTVRGSLSVIGNNQDTDTSLYSDQIKDGHRISVWGPFPR